MDHRLRLALFVLAGATLGAVLVALSLGHDTHAAGPDRPFRAYAPGLAHDEATAAAAPTPTPSPSATPTATATPPSTPVPTPGAGDEINLQPQLDTAHAVSKLVTYATGATLTTTGADGSKYTLTLPPNSVLFDVTVTMTPIKALGGLPANGGLKAGVQLEPDAMSLGVPATLDIVPASPVPVAEEISFSYSGGGNQAYGYGMGVNASRTRFTIMHFSGWAIAGGTDAQRAAMFQSQVDSATNRISQRLAPIIEAERQRQLLGTATDEGSAEFVEAMARGLEEAYREVVQPAMDTAESLAEAGDIDSVEPGLQAFLSWERQMQLLGLDTLQAERAALWQQLERIMDKVRLNMRDRCFNQHDVSMAARLMGLARQFALMRGEAAAAEAFEDAQKCLTFKLDFDFVLTAASDSATAEVHVRALGMTVRLGLDASFPVAQPIEIVSHTAAQTGCTISLDDHVTKPFQVKAGRLVFATKDGKTELTDVELNVEPGNFAGTASVFCPGANPTSGPVELEGPFYFMHEGDLDRALGGVRIFSWDMIRGSVFARRIYSQTKQLNTALTFTELTTFDLRHTPE